MPVCISAHLLQCVCVGGEVLVCVGGVSPICACQSLKKSEMKAQEGSS